MLRLLVATIFVFSSLVVTIPSDLHATTVCAVSPFVTKDGYFDTSSFHLATGDYVMAADCLVTSVGLWLSSTGSPTTRPINIYADSGGLPGTILVSSSNIGAVADQLEMRSVASYCITAGTHFHVGIEKAAAEQYNVGYNSAGSSVNYGIPPAWLDLGTDTFLFEVDGDAGCSGPQVASILRRIFLFDW